MTTAALHPVLDEKEYGALANNLVNDGQPYYVTTAISYTNGSPHLGHAYEFVTADVTARLHRMQGEDVWFVTGTDEHGQKVAASAEARNVSPLEHCNYYVDLFQQMHKRLGISYSHFQRTTTEQHKETARLLWKKCSDNGDIYLSNYEGWYNEREETFVSNSEAEANQFLDPASGLPLKRVVESSYFFTMSKFCDRLISHIEMNPEFIQPEGYRNQILKRLQKEGLIDLSISRTSFNWGITVPEGFEQEHVMYVWFDALTNYISGVDGLNKENPLSKYWPASTHFIGKDIVWFHAVIWPCMLMSAGVDLPKTIFCHGFVNDESGRKMSKSLNNVVDPAVMLDKYPLDSIRYYLCSSATYGSDLNFSEAALIQAHNSELADILGNLVHRVTNLVQKYSEGLILDAPHDEKYSSPFDMNALREGVAKDIAEGALQNALYKAMDAARATNRFLTEAEPWKMKGDDESRRSPVVRTTLEAVYAFTHFLAPFMPFAAAKVFDILGTKPIPVNQLRDDFYNLSVGTKVNVGEILFKKIETDGDGPGKVGGKGKAAAPAPVVFPNDFAKVDIRVGKITRVWPHEKSPERLYCEEIDVGEDVPRQVASGLVSSYKAEDLLNRHVLVVCNLKESKFQGFMSYGMVLGCKNADGVISLLEPPVDSQPGDRLFVAGGEEFSTHGPGRALDTAAMKKQKMWETVSPGLRTDATGVPCWNGQPLLTKAGPLTPSSLHDVQIQ